MAGMTMIVFEIDGREIMLSDADSIHTAMTNGTVAADTMVTVYLSDGTKYFKPAAQHKQLSAYFPLAVEPEATDLTPLAEVEPVLEREPVALSTAERLKALEEDIAANPDVAANRAWTPPIEAARPLPARYDRDRVSPRNLGEHSAPVIGKSRVTAAILALLLGGLGMHKFYMGKARAGGIMLAIMLFGAMTGAFFWASAFIGLVEGILYLTQSDAEFEERYFIAHKDWF